MSDAGRSRPARSNPPDSAELGRRLQIVCRMCDRRIRAMSPGEWDERLQIYIAQAMGLSGRIEATRKLCNMAIALRKQRDSLDHPAE